MAVSVAFRRIAPLLEASQVSDVVPAVSSLRLPSSAMVSPVLAEITLVLRPRKSPMPVSRLMLTLTALPHESYSSAFAWLDVLSVHSPLLDAVASA
jgi:hypothetical protein